MKKLLALLIFTASTLLLFGCALPGGNKSDQNGDSNCPHTKTVWEYMSGATCDMQYTDSTAYVSKKCVECGAHIEGVEFSCNEFILHKPDDNGYCADCEGYDLVKTEYAGEDKLSYSWEADGVKYSFSYTEDKFAYVEASGDNTVEKYYSTVEDGYGNIIEISKKTYENGRITESLTNDASPSEFSENIQFIFDMIRLIGVMDPRNPDVRFEKTGTLNYPVSYNNKGEIIEFTVPLNVYSIYYTEEGVSRLVSSGVAMFDDRIVSFTDERGDEPIVYTFDDKFVNVVIPEKAEDEFFLALAELEKYKLFSNHDYVIDQTIVETVGDESVTVVQKIVNNSDGATLTEAGGKKTSLRREDDGVYITVSENGIQITREKIEGEFLEDMKLALTLGGLPFLIEQYLTVYDFSYDGGLARFVDPEHPEGYVHVYVEDGRIVRFETLGFDETAGGELASSLNNCVITYGE